MNNIAEWISTARNIAVQCRLGMTLEAGVAITGFLPVMANELIEKIDGDFIVLINDLNKCHKNSDWLGVADCLEFDLVIWLERLNSASG
ncbi:hypothetical protein [Azonexus hydrophilus]|jgi:hypothetical protein|uniref:Prophage protein n=1 Tax=Azonexus hydrophilus TaxID=418702 RepID=A0ABZ2XFS1_9RHOO|nr:hypothetical protein [Dechloromonas sp.]